MSRLETRMKKLETQRLEPDLLAVFFDTGKDELARQREEFIEKHGREPDHAIVVRFV